MKFVGDLMPAPGPARRMGVLTVVQSLGTGMFLTSSTIFFVTIVKLPAGQFAAALSFAGLFGFLCAEPAGRAADRFGPRRPLAASFVLLSAFLAAYAFVDNIVDFAVVTCGIAIFETIGSPLRGALVHALFGTASAARVRAQMRGIFNLGFTGGAALAAVALAIGTHAAFATVICFNAIAQLGCGVIAYRLRPADESSGRRSYHRSRVALKDRSFLTATVLCGVLELFQPIVTVGLPLWIVNVIDVPSVTMAGLTILNTIIVVLFQVKASNGADTVYGSARLLARAGLFLAAACVFFALSQVAHSLWAIALLVPGIVVLALGEVTQAGGAWGLSFTLPPEGRMGEYQGVFALSRGFQLFVGPAFVTSLVLGIGAQGWLLLGAVFVLAGLSALRLFGRPPLDQAATVVSAPQ